MYFITKEINLIFLGVGQDIQFEVIIEVAMIQQEISNIYIFHVTKMNLNVQYRNDVFQGGWLEMVLMIVRLVDTHLT